MEISKIAHQLALHLESQIPNGEVGEIYRYSVLPAGKLFRPSLVWATALDLQKNIRQDETSKHAFLASAVEIHHAYTLVHDDLPCMDDDDMRRGRPSVHKAYGEWAALLAGDGLLNASYGLLSNIQSPNLGIILKIFAKFLGPQGLIKGQANDLSGEISKSFESLLETHKLKTARLIQVSILSSYLLTDSFSYRMFIDLLKLGHHMGIVFQLFDDFTEFTEKGLSTHENDVNPWPKYGEETMSSLKMGIEKIDNLIKKHGLKNLNEIISDYYANISAKLHQGRENLELNGIPSLTADSVSNFIGQRYH